MSSPSRTRIPLVVWVITLLGFLASASSSLVVPTYLGFDEPQHVDMVVALAHGDGWADPGERHLSLGVATSSNLYYSHRTPKVHPLDAALPDVAPRGDRGSLADLGGDTSTVGGNPNQIVQHPPLYYGIVAVVVKALGASDWSYDKLVELMRLVTCLLVAPIPLIAWAICRRLRTSSQVATAAAALSIALPGVARVAGMVNNDGLLILTASVLLLALVHVVTGDLSRRTAVLTGVATGLALMSKGFALALLPLVLVAFALGAQQYGDRLLSCVKPLAWALGIGFVTGGFWWARNLLAFGAIQPQGYGQAAMVRIQGPFRPEGQPAPLGPYLHGVRLRLTKTFWGGVGVADNATTVGVRTAVVLSVLLLVLVVAGIVFGVRGQGRRAALAMLVAPAPLALLVVLQGSHSAYVKHASLPGLQGRYLYLGVVGMAITAALTLDRLLGPARRALPVLAVLLALVLQAHHARNLVRALWLPDSGGSLRDARSHLELISPFPAAATDLVFALTGLVAVVLVALVVRDVLRPEPVEPPTAEATEPLPALA